MRVVAHLTKFTDWEPVPSDVKVTPQDIAAGKVMHARVYTTVPAPTVDTHVVQPRIFTKVPTPTVDTHAAFPRVRVKVE